MDAEYGFSKKISAACGFSVAMQLRKNEIETNVRGGKRFVPSPRHCLLRCFAG